MTIYGDFGHFGFEHLLWESIEFFVGHIDQKFFQDGLEHQKIFILFTNLQWLVYSKPSYIKICEKSHIAIKITTAKWPSYPFIFEML